MGLRGPGSPRTDGWLHTCRLYLFAATCPPYTLHPRAWALPTRPLHLDRPGPRVLAVVSLTTCVRTTQPCTLRTQRQTTFGVTETSLKKQALQMPLRMLEFP